MSLIKAVTPLLGIDELSEFKKCISTYNMARARVIVDDAKEGWAKTSEEYLILDGVENDIIMEIESSYDMLCAVNNIIGG